MQPHPAQLEIEALLADCEIRRQRRSGPGGQHRNKVETGVFIRHVPSGVEAGATERRSQDQNQKVALQRLRLKLAVEVRRDLPADFVQTELWKSRLGAGKLSVSVSHEDFASMVAEALDVLAAADYAVHLAAERLGCTGSQLTKLLRAHQSALGFVNQQRLARGLGTLK